MHIVRKHCSDRDIVGKRLNEGSFGVLSLIDESEQPYGVPINYVYDDTMNVLYFHSKRQGHKIKAIHHDGAAHFSVVLSEKVMPHIYTTNYESIFLRGRVTEVTDDEERMRALLLLCARLAPNELSRRDEVIKNGWSRVAILRFDIDTMSSKINQDS